MSWQLTAGLTNLRNQVNARLPHRDKASDGTIGDTAHQASTSGHNPDDTAGSHPAWDGDSDSKQEVRAWDMDSDLGEPGVDAQDVVDHLRRLPGLSSVIRYMIYNHRMYHSRDGFAPTAYTGPSPHEEHIHFEGAWTQTADENTTFNYRLDDLGDPVTENDFKTWMTEWAKSSAGREALAKAVLAWDPGLVDGKVPPGGVINYGDDAATNPTVQPAWSIGRAQVAVELGYENRARLDQVLAQLAALAGRDFVNEQAIIDGVIAALPEGADQITQDEVTTAVKTAMRDAFSSPTAS